MLLQQLLQLQLLALVNHRPLWRLLLLLLFLRRVVVVVVLVVVVGMRRGDGDGVGCGADWARVRRVLADGAAVGHAGRAARRGVGRCCCCRRAVAVVAAAGAVRVCAGAECTGLLQL